MPDRMKSFSDFGTMFRHSSSPRQSACVAESYPRHRESRDFAKPMPGMIPQGLFIAGLSVFWEKRCCLVEKIGNFRKK
jgi:hypothetical protein